MRDIQPGDIIKDRITEGTGVVVCRSEWLYGCVRLVVQPQKVKEDGTLPETFVIDEPQATFMGRADVDDSIKHHNESRPEGGQRADEVARPTVGEPRRVRQ